jgi:hypothetical protein
MSTPHTLADATHQDLHPTELLNYLPEYGVVVCTRCKYAIQPNAIPRHLKDIHRIHRSRRRPFMKYISTLDLKPPEDVISFTLVEFPVLGLPIHDGLSCTTCHHLCISEKRMKHHMISVHSQIGQKTIDWLPTPLQTFFRGNLMRYFTAPDFSAPLGESHCLLPILNDSCGPDPETLPFLGVQPHSNTYIPRREDFDGDYKDFQTLVRTLRLFTFGLS